MRNPREDIWAVHGYRNVSIRYSQARGPAHFLIVLRGQYSSLALEVIHGAPERLELAAGEVLPPNRLHLDRHIQTQIGRAILEDQRLSLQPNPDRSSLLRVGKAVSNAVDLGVTAVRMAVTIIP